MTDFLKYEMLFGCLDLGNQGLECGQIVDRQFRKLFAIQLDAGLTDALHKAAVRHSFRADCGINADGPQSFKITLAFAAVAISELAGADEVFLGGA